MRSTLRGPLGWAMAAGLVIAACGGTATPGANAPSTPKIGSADKPIVLAITPSAEVQRLTTTGNAIAAALGRSTGLNWKVIVPTSYAAEIESVCAGQTDVAFIAPLQMTLLIDKQCGQPVLAALRNDEKCILSPSYNSQILVRADSGITDINGLKGKMFAFVDAVSASGYLFPNLIVKNKTGQDPKTFFSSTIFAGGHPQSVLALYNGQVQGAASFGDARLVSPCPPVQLAPGMPADILEKTKVIDSAGPIPNDGVAIRTSLPPDVAAQVKSALLDYGTTTDGKANYKSLFQWDGLKEVSANFYDSIRDAAKLAGIDVAGIAAQTPRPPATPSPSPSKSP